MRPFWGLLLGRTFHCVTMDIGYYKEFSSFRPVSAYFLITLEGKGSSWNLAHVPYFSSDTHAVAAGCSGKSQYTRENHFPLIILLKYLPNPFLPSFTIFSWDLERHYFLSCRREKFFPKSEFGSVNLGCLSQNERRLWNPTPATLN